MAVADVRASVLIPTHDHASTLPLTVGSVLAQTVADLEVLVIGDGVTVECRESIEPLVRSDDRVRFLDFPKGPHHGEVHRHEAVLAARSDAILYLCDDDLVLPEHVADLLGLLEDATFVQSRNGYLTATGAVRLSPTDLSDPRCVAWHLVEPRRNQTSITGSGHSRTWYLEVDDPWETTPAGEWPDHYQWKKFFRRPDFRGATSHRMTALQFPSHLEGRDTWTAQQRHDELAAWAARIGEPGAQAQIDALVDRATQQALAVSLVDADLIRAEVDHLWSEVRDRDAHLDTLRGALRDKQRRIRRLRDRAEQRGRERDRARAELDELKASLSWRLGAPLRRLRRR